MRTIGIWAMIALTTLIGSQAASLLLICQEKVLGTTGTKHHF